MTTTTKPERAIVPTITTTPEVAILANYEGPRVTARNLRVSFVGRMDAKGWHDSERGNVTECYHVCRVNLADPDHGGECVINGIVLDGWAACVYRMRWIGKDADGDSIRELGWDYDYAQGYVRRKGKGWSEPLTDGARKVLYSLMEAIARAAVTPERLRAGEWGRLTELANSEIERAEDYDAKAKAARDNAAALQAQAAEANDSESPAPQSDAERVYNRDRR